MTRWFVYCDQEFYPWAEVVEAESAEDAERDLRGRAFVSDHVAVAVAPFDAVRVFAENPSLAVEDWTREGQC